MAENTVLIPATAIESIGTTLSSNITAVAPAILGVMAITIVAGVILNFVRKHTRKS